MSKSSFDPEMFNRIYPVRAARFYENGTVEVIRGNKRVNSPKPPKRGKIKELSKASRQRLALVALETQVEFSSLITLTYGVTSPTNGKSCKADLRKMLNRLIWWYGKFDYLWFLEFQRRGSPHIHVLCSVNPPATDKAREYFSSLWVDDVLDRRQWEYSRLSDGKRMNERDSMLWFHSRPQQWEKLRSPDGAARYCLKYALKTHQKIVPSEYGDVGRFWGHTLRVGKLKYVDTLIHEDTIRKIIRRHRPDIAGAEILPRVVYGVLPRIVSRETI